MAKAREEADIWIQVNKTEEEAVRAEKRLHFPPVKWLKPIRGWVKCNVGVSWINCQQHCGASWILRDDKASVLFHGRRSYNHVETRLEADFNGLFWAVQNIINLHQKRITLEVTSRQVKEAIIHPHQYPMFRHIISQIRDALDTLEEWRIECIPYGINRCAQAIAVSVTRDYRYQSYIAREGPSWIRSLLNEDANIAMPQEMALV